MKKNNITIYDVAREAGVSLATVSRVINGSSVVREKTKNKVLEVINRLDYKPNEIARGLATNKTTTIGVVFPQSMFAHVKNMISGVGDVAQTLDYSVNMYTTLPTGDNDVVKDLTERIVKSRVDGVILFYNDYVQQMVESIKKYDIPVVVIGYKIEDENIGSIYFDVKQAAYEIIKDVLSRGVKKFVYASPKQNLINNDLVVEGIQKALNEVGLAFHDDMLITCLSHYESNYPMFKDYFAKHRPELVFCGYDKDSVAALNGAIDNGIKIPEDMEIIGMLNSSYSIMTKPTISTLNVPVYDMGALAVRLLTKLLNDEELESKQIVVKHNFIKRNSTKG